MILPKKLLTYAAHFHDDFADAAGFGWTVPAPTFSWPTLIANKNKEIARLEGIYRGLITKAGAELIDGGTVLADPHTVEVNGRRVTAEHIVVATGGWPVRPNIPGADKCITSNEVFELPALPERVIIIGAGYVALEFAGIFAGLGTQVMVAYRGEEILRGFDDDVRSHLHAELAKKGIHIRVRSDLVSVDRDGAGVMTVGLREPDGVAHFEADAVMLATGRAPNTRGLGLTDAGVVLDDAGAVVVDEWSRSSVPSIHAIGDVTNRVALTPVAIREGAALASTLFGGVPASLDHADIPHAVFTNPQIGAVGMTQRDALEKYESVEIYKSSFRPLKHTLSGRDERTFVKLVVEPASQRVLGAHMVGADAPEIIQGVAIAVKAGLTKADFDRTVAIHPTAAEELVTLRDPVTVRR